MGIPSYFSHIIKNHNIIIKKPNLQSVIQNLYIDSNSIIYDIIYSLDTTDVEFEIIYEKICSKILLYIEQLQPQNLVYIAFDGIAPIAKLSQQRTRRIKNVILKKINNKLSGASSGWDTTQITPGTEFMKSLNKYIQHFFTQQKGQKYTVKLSLTDEAGEGEHKLFRYIRDHNHTDQTTVVYGLDADLIMLSLLHTKYCSQIYLYRETPHFIKQLDSSLNPAELYLISINDLCDRIASGMTNNQPTCENKTRVMTDYIFICFMLGNDFIPHNPSINIRTNGIDILLEIYKKFHADKKFIIDEKGSIEWKNFRAFMQILSSEEENYLKYEHSLRNKHEKRRFPTGTDDEIQMKLNYLPSIHREGEIYINPNSKGWQTRYYNTLFDVEYNEIRRKQICFQYLEALEWTWKYYSQECYDWRWKYDYDYAPLFEDVVKYIPYYQFDFIKHSTEPHINNITQLIYVLPSESHYLLPTKVQTILQTKFAHWFDKETISFKWDYCKYLWEAHLTLPDMDIQTIEKSFT